MCRRACVSLLLALALLSGCAGGEGGTSPESAADQGGGSLTASQVESSPRPLTEEEILAAYSRAEEAWGWFDLSPLPDSGELAYVDGVQYRRVSSPGLDKAEDLRTYLRSLFTSELTERLLSGGGTAPPYRDIDGALYVRVIGRRRRAGRGDAQAAVTQLDETSYTVDVTVQLLDSDGETAAGLESWSFPYALVEGRWVFTDFCLVY